MRVLDFSDGFTTESAPTVSGGTASQSQFLAGDGAVGAPAFTFTSDGDSGLYRIGSNNLGLSLGGTKYVDFGTSKTTYSQTLTANVFEAGTSGFASTGVVRIPNNERIAFRDNGDSADYSIRLNTSDVIQANIDMAVQGQKSGSTMQFLVENSATSTNSSTHAQVLVQTMNGNVGNPSIAFGISGGTYWNIGNKNTSGDVLSITKSTGATDPGLTGSVGSGFGVVTMDSEWEFEVVCAAKAGSAAAPGFVFHSAGTVDDDTGFYRIGADNIGISTGGTLRLDISTSSLSLSNGTKLQFTTVASPDSTSPTMANTPTGVAAGQTGWIVVLQGGTDRYIPYWT